MHKLESNCTYQHVNPTSHTRVLVFVSGLSGRGAAFVPAFGPAFGTAFAAAFGLPFRSLPFALSPSAVLALTSPGLSFFALGAMAGSRRGYPVLLLGTGTPRAPTCDCPQTNSTSCAEHEARLPTLHKKLLILRWRHLLAGSENWHRWIRSGRSCRQSWRRRASWSTACDCCVSNIYRGSENWHRRI